MLSKILTSHGVRYDDMQLDLHEVFAMKYAKLLFDYDIKINEWIYANFKNGLEYFLHILDLIGPIWYFYFLSNLMLLLIHTGYGLPKHD